MANISAFIETRKNFIESTQWSKQLSYEEWCEAPRDHKAALLFVNFYDKMIQAWDKANSFDYIPSPDGVSIVCQYLEKNVSKIEADSKKYSEPYLYTVAYNCMYCICHDLKSVKDRWENETSNTVNYQGDELDLFATVSDSKGSAEDESFKLSNNKAFWELVEGDDPKCQKVINYLLSGDPSMLKKLTKRNRLYNVDPLRDVEVSLEEAQGIIQQIKERLEKSADMFGYGSMIS